MLRILILALWCVGCGGEDFAVQLSFDEECPSAACADYLLPCGGVALIQVRDPGGTITSSRCEAIPVGDLCGLQELDVSLGGFPQGDATLEVAIWNAEELAAPTACPTDGLFDLRGRPRNGTPIIALGRAIAADLGSAATFTVPLTCAALSSLESQCVSQSVVITYETIDAALPITSAEADSIFVERVTVAGDEVVPGQPLVRAVPEPEVPTWQATLVRGELSVQTRVPHANFVSSLGVAQSAHTLRYVDAATLQTLQDTFGSLDGATIGVVTDSLGLPVEGAVVDASAGTVRYLGGGAQTDASGLFVGTDAAYGVTMVATYQGMTSIAGVGGALDDALSLVHLELR